MHEEHEKICTAGLQMLLVLCCTHVSVCHHILALKLSFRPFLTLNKHLLNLWWFIADNCPDFNFVICWVPNFQIWPKLQDFCSYFVLLIIMYSVYAECCCSSLMFIGRFWAMLFGAVLPPAGRSVERSWFCFSTGYDLMDSLSPQPCNLCKCFVEAFVFLCSRTTWYASKNRVLCRGSCQTMIPVN